MNWRPVNDSSPSSNCGIPTAPVSDSTGVGADGLERAAVAQRRRRDDGRLVRRAGVAEQRHHVALRRVGWRRIRARLGAARVCAEARPRCGPSRGRCTRRARRAHLRPAARAARPGCRVARVVSDRTRPSARLGAPVPSRPARPAPAPRRSSRRERAGGRARGWSTAPRGAIVGDRPKVSPERKRSRSRPCASARRRGAHRARARTGHFLIRRARFGVDRDGCVARRICPP